MNLNGDEVERALTAGFVIIYGITLHSSFEDLNPQNFIYTAQGGIIGGHCMEAYKYDKATGRIRSRRANITARRLAICCRFIFRERRVGSLQLNCI